MMSSDRSTWESIVKSRYTVLRALSVSIILTILYDPALAQFKAEKTPTFPASGSFECGILRLSPRDSDNDPIYKIIINVGRDENDDSKTIKTLTVAHVSTFGKVYARDDQYDNSSLKQITGKLEVLWRGTWKKNRLIVMAGRLWNDSMSNRWFYSESQTRNGSPAMELLAGCHPQE